MIFCDKITVRKSFELTMILTMDDGIKSIGNQLNVMRNIYEHVQKYPFFCVKIIRLQYIETLYKQMLQHT